MKRVKISPRENWRAKVEQLGFSYHTLDGAIYWDETAYYEFSYEQVAQLERSTTELYRLCLLAVDHVIRNNMYELFSIPAVYIPFIESQWKQHSPSIYGRFDLAWNGEESKAPKMLEFNADTPTSLFEAGAVQWFWLNDIDKHKDQFNSIHLSLIDSWKNIRVTLKEEPLYFSCMKEFPEDYINVSYLRDCAEQAGISTRFIDINDIGMKNNSFVDLKDCNIKNIFKLYPWEWLINEEYGPCLLQSQTNWFEPAWKMILSNKAILPMLWELFPGHPNLLESYFYDPGRLTSYAEKPLLSREGSNVTLVEDGKVIQATSGDYGEEGFIYQQLYKLPCFDGNYPVIGSWIIGDKAAGIGVRETTSLVTDNFSRFLPHMIA